MPRLQNHAAHGIDKMQRNRVRIAQEAARLMAEHGIRDFQHAKRKAALHLGMTDTQSLPRNDEIADALREHQRLFLADSQPRWLQMRREAAVTAMNFLQAFTPRLVGAVLEGTADQHSAVCLQVFSDNPDTISLFLRDQRVPLETQSRRLRTGNGPTIDYPVLLFSADGLPFDLTVLPRQALRQAPWDSAHDRPMRRASLAQLQALLAQDAAGTSDH